MGKTKTMFVTGTTEKKSGKEAYEEKIKKREAEEAKAAAGSKKTQVKGVGLKGGDRIKVVGAEEIPAESVAEVQAKPELEETEAPIEEPTKVKKPKIRSNHYKSAKAKIDKNKLYSLDASIKLLKEISYSTFDPTVELHLIVKTQGLSANVNLPYSTGKQKRIEIADENTIEKLKTGKIDFDMLLSTAEMMPKLVPFARVLGPKGLMPNPKNGTLIKSKKDAEKFSGNSVTIKTEKEAPVIHTTIGKLSQKENELIDNTKAIFDGIGSKIIVKAFIKSTMSPSIKIVV